VSVDLANAVAIRDGATAPEASQTPTLDQDALEAAASKVEDALEDVRAA
jgi:hypothetical protein